MMFKGPMLRHSCLVFLFALLFASGTERCQAQTGQSLSYRILILDNLAPTRLQDAKSWLAGMQLPAPVRYDVINGQVRITCGDFSNQAQAEAVRKTLYEKEGLRTNGLITVSPEAPAVPPALLPSDEVLTIFARDFKDRAQAETEKRKLETRFGSVMIRQVGDFYEILVGQYDARQAPVALGQLRKAGYQTARVVPLPPAPQPAPAQPFVEPVAAPPSTGIDDPTLPITQSAEWKKMTEAEKRNVLSNVEMQVQIRKGDPLAKQMIDIAQRMNALDDRVKQITQSYESEKQTADERREKLLSLIQDAENNIRAGKYSDANVLLNSALELDKQGVFGQVYHIKQRIEAVKSLSQGEDYPGQLGSNKKRIAGLNQQINQLKISKDPQQLYQAINLLAQIKELDSTQAASVDQQIAQLNQVIRQAKEADDQAAESSKKDLMMIVYGLAGGVGFLGLVVLLFWMRTRKRHMELMRKVQEITSIRPMRELEGGGPQMLGATESDIFSPMTPAVEGVVGDPLGGVLTSPPPPDKKTKGKKGKEAAPVAAVAAASDSLDDLFGGGSPATGSPDLGGGGDMGFDDIFGSPTPAPAAAAPKAQAAPPAAPEPPTQSQENAIDDIFGGLFTDEQKPAAKQVTPEVDEENSPAHDTGPISLGDFMAVSSGNQGASTETVDSSDLLTVADDSDKSNGQEVDPLQDSPFASLFSDEAPKEPVTSKGYAKEDETEIPSIKLDATVGGSTVVSPSMGAFELHDISQADSTTPAAESLDLPSFSFDDFMGSTSVTSGNGAPGTTLDFESDPVSQSPQGWEGQYPFARLTVEADTPPRGSQQYLCFEKKEGSGKAHFSYRFNEVSGVVGIEFDLRCNDKNKFLLGFYIEKDGDFQHSIHTKILRSEAQTSPTIHMQGQSAPYLLGSWTHIKYVVDLNEGKINGYIDSTHVVRDLPLSPNPGTLNTLSIRDNINTTGVLLLDNIKVYQAQ